MSFRKAHFWFHLFFQLVPTLGCCGLPTLWMHKLTSSEENVCHKKTEDTKIPYSQNSHFYTTSHCLDRLSKEKKAHDIWSCIAFMSTSHPQRVNCIGEEMIRRTSAMPAQCSDHLAIEVCWQGQLPQIFTCHSNILQIIRCMRRSHYWRNTICFVQWCT